MPLLPWQAAQTAALVAPAAASPCIGACLRRSSKGGAAASATPMAIASNAIGATSMARVVTITAASLQFHVEHHADEVGAVMRLRPEVGVDPVVDHQVVLQPEVMPVGKAAGDRKSTRLNSSHPS